MSSEITVGSRVAFLFAVCQAIFLIHNFVQPWTELTFLYGKIAFYFGFWRRHRRRSLRQFCTFKIQNFLGAPVNAIVVAMKFLLSSKLGGRQWDNRSSTLL